MKYRNTNGTRRQIMINIVTSGCSFTHDPDSWANVLQKKLSDKYTVTNVAQGGVGQEYIVRSAIMKLQQLTTPKLCIVQFSGFWRATLHLDKLENPELFEKLKSEKIKWDTRQCYNESIKIDNMIMLKTTDLNHAWWDSSKLELTSKIINGYNLAVSSDQRTMLSYENISHLQMYCKLNKIPLLCFFGWQDCLEHPYNIELVNQIREQVDWKNIWFHKNGGGMAEWMLDNGHHGKLEEDKTNNPPTGLENVRGHRLNLQTNKKSEKTEWKRIMGTLQQKLTKPSAEK